MVIDRVDHSNVLNPILRTKGVCSLLGVPLLLGSEVLGVLHVGSLTPRRFTTEDTELLRLVADRVALAVEARSLRADHVAAVALQRSLLPAKLPSVEGVEFAARYVAGGKGQVGGDWYDAFVLPTGVLWVVIGDVLGWGLSAAIAMGRLRSALRAYALEFDDPAVVLSKLDREVQQFEPGIMATVLCGVLSRGVERLRLSSAGHPPIIAAQGQVTRLVDIPADLPIGVELGRRRRRVTELALPEDAVLCLYTDGLVERRHESIDVGLQRLRAVVSCAQPDEVCADVMNALVGAEAADDDIAVLALHRPDRTKRAPRSPVTHGPAVPEPV